MDTIVLVDNHHPGSQTLDSDNNTLPMSVVESQHSSLTQNIYSRINMCSSEHCPLDNQSEGKISLTIQVDATIKSEHIV